VAGEFQDLKVVFDTRQGKLKVPIIGHVEHVHASLRDHRKARRMAMLERLLNGKTR
jgi:hypothetical protein